MTYSRYARFLVAGAGLLLLSASRPATAQDCEEERCAAQSAIAAACPCESAANHGEYVSCVASEARTLVSEECRGAVVRCAARSTCGKDAVACLRPKRSGGCDPETGTCRKKPSLTCESARDCVVGTKCTITRSGDRCMAKGGTVSGSNTCCADCGPPVPTTTNTTQPGVTTTATTATTSTTLESPSGAFLEP